MAESSDDREAAIEEAKTLISAGMVAELIVEVRRVAGAVLDFGAHLESTQTRTTELERRDAENESLRRRNTMLGVAALVSSSVAVIAVLVLGLVLMLGNGELQEQTDLLIECTTPTTTTDEPPHECYERGRAQTAEAVGQIVRGSIEAVICARQHADDQSIRDCVAHRLSQP